MRIDGKDATMPVQIKAPEQKSETRENNANSHTTNAYIEGRAISQMSDLERRELPISEKVLVDAIEKANRIITGANRKFEISIHEKTREVMVKVINSDTNEVVREIPPEKLLDLVAKLWEMAGIIVDERR